MEETIEDWLFNRGIPYTDPNDDNENFYVKAEILREKVETLEAVIARYESELEAMNR